MARPESMPMAEINHPAARFPDSIGADLLGRQFEHRNFPSCSVTHSLQ
jgi:hypothetical protein